MRKMRFFISTLLMLFVCLTACKKMDSTYKEYVIPGGYKYTGMANSAQVYPGYNRVKVSWLRGADPSVTSARIFWNNYADSVELNIPLTGDTISYIINNLLEQSYSFVIKTYDAEGNYSVPVEVVGESFGENYQTGLLNRYIISSIMETDVKMQITWGNPDITGGANSTEVEYTNVEGEVKTKRFEVSDSKSAIEDYKAGTDYRVRTLYMPDSMSIDTFYTSYEVQKVIAIEKFDKSIWTATADSEEPRDTPHLYKASRAIDNDVNTFWHTPWTVRTPFPHWLAVDMKSEKSVAFVELTCRQNNVLGITRFDIQGSVDGVTWVTYESNLTLLQQNATQRFIVNERPRVRHVRIWATAGGDTPTHLAELSIFGY